MNDNDAQPKRLAEQYGGWPSRPSTPRKTAWKAILQTRGAFLPLRPVASSPLRPLDACAGAKRTSRTKGTSRTPRRPAFTLVELLVAIGIIAVLIGILLPVLSRARESANRTACLANIRSLDQALSLYANEYRDRVPLGHIEDEFQWDYTANFADGSSVFVTHLGLLKDAKLLQAPQTFYCPSEADPQWVFNTPENPWPFVTVPSATATTPASGSAPAPVGRGPRAAAGPTRCPGSRR